MESIHKYWFPAKRYGWGRGLPCAWQGWLVFAAFLALVIAGIFLFPPARSLSRFIIYTTLISALLVAVCWLKGEPPRWRWGSD